MTGTSSRARRSNPSKYHGGGVGSVRRVPGELGERGGRGWRLRQSEDEDLSFDAEGISTWRGAAG